MNIKSDAMEYPIYNLFVGDRNIADHVHNVDGRALVVVVHVYLEKLPGILGIPNLWQAFDFNRVKDRLIYEIEQRNLCRALSDLATDFQIEVI